MGITFGMQGELQFQALSDVEVADLMIRKQLAATVNMIVEFLLCFCSVLKTPWFTLLLVVEKIVQSKLSGIS